MNDIFSLNGKNVLVTGASSGIGRAVAVESSKAGANVYITGRNEERLHETLGLMAEGTHKAIIADFTDDEEIAILVASIDKKLDGIVLCAGVNDKVIIKLINSEHINKLLSTNFIGPVSLIQKLMKKKLINKQCSVVFMSSVSAFYPSVSNAMYAASKAAVNQFAKVLALELFPLKGRVNCIEPAFVETEMIHKYPQELLDEIRTNYPLGRFARPEEIAYSVIFYLSDATQLITGTQLIIDGGYTLRS